MRLILRNILTKQLIVAIFCGILTSLASGLFENPPEASIIGAEYYGYPIVWRVVMVSLTKSVDYRIPDLVANTLFWIVAFFFALLVIGILTQPKLRQRFNYKKLVLPLALFIPLGIVMDFVHEFGHAIWGSALGGKLGYMQVTWLVVYPKLAITHVFRLGYVEVTGLSSPFSHGVFLLGGSLTTNIVAWLLAIILLKMNFEYKKRAALKILGFFGLLDLPFYVFFPQIGLRHWIFLGGNSPEPLIGAREIGVADPIFYIMVTLTTLGLLYLYLKSLRGYHTLLGFIRSVWNPWSNQDTSARTTQQPIDNHDNRSRFL